MKDNEKKESRQTEKSEPGNEYTKQQSRTGSVDKGYDFNKRTGSKVDERPNLKKSQIDEDSDEMDDDLS